MSQRITPLTRNQLLELEALVRNLVSAVAQLQRRSAMSGKNNNISNSLNASSLFPSTTPHSVGDASQQSSAPSTPSSLSSSKMHPRASGAAPSAASGFLVGPNGAPPQPHARRSSIVGDGAEEDAEGGEDRDVHFHGGSGAAASEAANHPVLRGAFLDVFADPWTATAWRVYDKMLYVVWWSYRPPSCAKCGMQDAWMPSGDVEYQCTFCLSGAGTTRSNAVVEDIPASKEDMDDVEDSGDDDDAVDTLGTSGGGGAPSAVSTGKVGAAAGVSAVGVGSGAGGGGPIDAYLFFYEWLQRIPLLGSAGSTDGSTNDNANTTTSSGPAAPPASSAASQRHDGAPVPTARPHASSAPAAAFGAATSATRQAAGAGSGRRPVEGSGSGGAASGVLLPSGEALPMVLRAAYDMSSLLTAPGLPRGTAPCIRAAALYLSLLLHRFVSLFPLFCLAGRGVTGAETRSLPTTSSATAAAALSGSAAASAPRAEVELQWVDVELISALLGVTAPSFFESTEVSLQHLQNIFTVAAAYGVPSVLWHPGRVPGRVDAMKALKDRAVPLCPMPFSATGVSGLSPELTAVVVALELARRVDGQPIAASSSSPAAAAQNAQRIGMWLDALGLYPTRRSYRDPNSFHQHLLDTAPEELAGRGGRALSSADHAAQRNHSERDDEEDAAAARKHRVLTAWEQTLTGLAAAKDASLLAAAERHAHRHDANADSASAPSAASSSAAPALTTPTSPFHKRFEWILTSPCANALLHVFAAVFRLTPMELADAALRSGLYGGSASGFVATLRTAVQRGSYDVMPLSRRLSPLTSSWMCAYMALHSGDRLPLLTALRQLNDAQNSTRDRQGALTRLVQRILRKQQAPQLYQFNYVLRVTDEVERHFNGVYFLSSVLWQEGLAIFTCLRSGRKTITLNRHTRRLTLCYMNAKEKLVERLGMHVAPPVVVAVETEAARQVLEFAVGAGAAVGGGDPWGSVVRSLDRCARVRRRMRVPMLASRLDALASIREQASAASRLQLQQLPASAAFFGPGAAAAAALGPTLRGWGDTETLLSAAPPLDVQQLRRDLQWNLLVLPHVSLLCGLSENRVVALYASLVGLLELLHRRLAGADAAVRTNWVEELLYVDDDVEDGADYDDGAADMTSGLPFAGGSGVGGGVGWSPPHYRNSRPGTPKLLRSPKSKFIAVSASTNASCGVSAFANGSSSAMGSASSRHSAFQHGSSSTSGTHGGRPRGPSPPLASAWQPYTMTPPSIAPSRSPVLRTNSGAGPRNASAMTTTTTSYHNAVATPTGPRLRTPPLTIASVGGVGGGGAGAGGGDARGSSPVPAGSKRYNSCGSGNGNGGKLRDAWASGVDGPLQPLPELELAESTADAAKRKTGQLLRRRKRGRAGGQDGGNDDDEDSGLDEDEEDTDNTAVESDAPLHRGSTRGSRASPRNSGAAVNASETERARSDHDAVLRLLRYAMPAYWEVLLGTATDLALAARATSGRGGAGDSDDDDDDAEEVDGSGTRMHSTTRGNAGSARRRRRTSPPEYASRSRGAAGAAAATAGGAQASEALITHTSFTVFDAEECRRRLQRVYAFIAVYEERKAALMQIAAEGKLPPAIPAPPPPQQQQQEKATLSAGAATTPGSRARMTSPHTPVRLSPPPPLLSSPPLAPKPASSATPTLGGKHSGISGSSIGAAAHAGRVQRSPPHAGRQPTPSPPIRPAVGSPPGSQRRARGEDSAATTGAAGRENASPSPTPSSVGSTSDMSSRRSPRPSTAQRHQGQPQLPQQQPYSTAQRASGRLEARGSKGPDARRSGTSDAADAARAGAAGLGEVVEEADFALPPSEVAWQASKARYSGTLSPVRASRRAERASGEATMSTRPSSTRLPAKPKLVDSQDSSRSSSDDSDDEELQCAAAPECEPASSSEAERDENEERDEDDGGRQRRDRHHCPPQRKRGRTAAAAHASDSDDVDDADREVGDDSDGLAAPLRRKTKKTGRRRRRLEQHQQQPPPRPQCKSSSRSTSRSPESAPSRGGGSGSRSPEQRVRPHPTSGGTSPPLTPSPATGPRGGEVGRKGKLSSPAAPAQAVPSIRARPERLGISTAAAPRSALGTSPASSPASSERSNDYDADTN